MLVTVERLCSSDVIWNHTSGCIKHAEHVTSPDALAYDTACLHVHVRLIGMYL